MVTQNETRQAGGKGDIADMAEDMKHRIKDRADELIATGEEKIEDLRSRLRGCVEEKPVTSLLIATGVGVLLGLLIARRR